jgi:hypothetical protein
MTNASPYAAGVQVNIRAVPAAGYGFVNWTGNVSTIANVNSASTTITMNSDCSITANFALLKYNLTVDSTAGGSVTTPGEGTFTYDEGTVVNLVATPGSGYRFVNWTAPAGSFSNASAATTTFTMPAQNVAVTARFTPVEGSKTQEVTNSTLDARDEADTEVEVTGTARVTVGPCEPSGWSGYEATPVASPSQPDWKSLGQYTDVSFNDTTKVTQTQIKLYYTDAQVTAAGISEETLRLFWWNRAAWAWVQCSDSGVNTDSNYMWAKIRNNTTPSLDDLQGTPWGGYGHPTEKGICFVATAAYGTDTAKEIDILREFRDEVLLPNSLGARLVSFYYRTSPPIADFISRHEVLRTAVRVGFIDPIVRILKCTHGLWST